MKIKKKSLEKWLDEYVTIVDINYGDDFYYSFGDQAITISKDLPDHIDIYKKFCYKKGLKYNVNDYVICLLHEVGHDQTILFLNEFLYWIDMKLAILLESIECYNYLLHWIVCQIYFRLPCEIIATKWMINFINNNLSAVRELESLYEV